MRSLVAALLLFANYGQAFIAVAPLRSMRIKHSNPLSTTSLSNAGTFEPINRSMRIKHSNPLSMSSLSNAGTFDPTNRAMYSVDTATAVDSMNSVDQTWAQLEDFGDILTRYTKLSLFFRALFAGLFVGFGGILTASVGFDVASGYPWLPGMGIQRFLSGAVGFPLAILLVSSTGCGAWTGDMLLVSRALFSKTKKTNMTQVMTGILLIWIGDTLLRPITRSLCSVARSL